jgi:hypothetical protein
MATDFRDYFNDRISQEIEKNALLGISTKYDQVQAASKEKQASLEDLRKLRLAQEAQAAASWAGQMGLDSQGIPSSLVNVGEAVFEGAKNTGRSIGAAADALTRNNAGIDALAASQKAAGEKGPIAKSMLMDEIERRKKADLNPGVISAVQNVSGAMFDNPQGTAEFIAEQLPNSAVALGSGLVGAKTGAVVGAALGPVGAAAGGAIGFLGGMFLGNAILETGSKAMEKAQDGGMTDAKRTEAIQEGAIKGGVITAVDAVTLGLGGKAAKTFNKAAIEAGARAEARVLANAGVDVTSLQAIETALADPILRGSAKAAGRAAAGQTSNIGTKAVTAATGLTMETVGEGTGEYLGELAATGKADVYDAVIEAAAGFTQSAPETAFAMRRARSNDLNAKGIAGADLSIPDPVAETRPAPKDRNAIKTAVETGDVSALLDQKSASYSPTDAIAALQGYASRADATPEAKKSSLEKATQIVADLEAKKAETQQAYDTVSPEGVSALRAKLDDAKANGDDTRAALLETMIADAGADPKAAARLQAQLAKADQQLMAAKSGLTTLHQELQAKDIDPEVEATKLKDPDPVVSAKAASDIINLSMTIPERLSPSLASEMADDTTNTLTEDQRAYLRKFSAARQAENELMGMDDVSKEIFLGNADKAMVGIKDYRAGVAAALDAGNRASASKQMAQLSRFVDDHNQKAALAQSALDSGVPSRLVSDGNGGWGLEPGLWSSEAARVENGGLNITMRSEKLVNQIKAEAGALTKAQDELIAAMKISTKEKTDGTQAAQAQQTEAQGQEAPSAAGARSDAASATDNAQDSTVQADDVNEEAPASAVATEDAAVETAATEEAKSSVEGQTQSTEKTTPTEKATVPQTGELAAVAETTEEGTAHNAKKFGDFFSQSAGKDTDGSKRALVSVKDFMTQWADKTVKLGDYLKAEALTDAQRVALSMFAAKSAQWSANIRRNLRPSHNALFNYEDPIRYLITGTGNKADIEENVKTAISAAVFAFVGDQAGRSSINNDAAINAILGRKGDDPVSGDAKRALQNVGTYQSAVIDSLGTKVIDALGLKLLKNAPQDMLAKLRASLGAHALKLMEDQGMVSRDAIPAAEITALRNEGKEEQDVPVVDSHVGDHYFFKLAEKSTDVSDALRGSQNVVPNLFGIESGIQAPSEEPKTKVQQTSDTGMGVTKLLKRVFRQKQTQDKWYVNQDPMKVLASFDEDRALEMAGVVAMTNETTHARNQKSQKAKNDGLVRNFKQFMDWVGERAAAGKQDEGFFYTPDMWKQQRAGLKETIGNPQTNKIARWLASPKEWATDVSLTDEGMMQGFKLRVAEGLGRKTEKSQSSKSVAWLDSKMQEPGMVAGVKALQQSLFTEEELSAEQQQAVVDAVAAGGEKFHTLAALIAYARYQQAVDTNAEQFTTNLMGEVDGVSNGSILNHVLYGAAMSADLLNSLLERGGIYTAKSIAQKYSEWYGNGNTDIYESNAKLVDEAITAQSAADPKFAELVSAIWATSKVPVDEEGNVTKGGRNLLKTALNPLNYGSGFKKIQQNMAAAYVDGIYAQFEVFSRESSSQQKIDAFVSSLNVLLKAGKQKPLPVGQPIAFYMRTELNKWQTKALEKAYTQTVGETATETIKESFGPLLEKTRLLTNTTQLSYELYDAVYQAMRKEMIQSLGIPVNKGAPIHDLSMEQERELQERMKSMAPVMHTAMSTDDGNINNGILLAKKERGTVNSPSYTVEVKFGTKLATGASQLTVRGQAMQQTSPGVMAISGSTQALDSKISHSTQLGRNILNVHDAVGDGIGSLASTSQAMNENTWDSLLNYSPLDAAHEALMQVVRGIVALDGEGKLSPAAKANLMAVLKKQENRTKGETPAVSVVPMAVYEVFNAALLANKTKLEAMSQWTSVDQYAFDGGSYAVTKDDRDMAVAMLNSLPSKMTAADEKTLFDFMDMTNGAPVADAQAKVEEIQAKAAEPQVTETPFGKLGQARKASDPALVAFFEANPNPTSGEVVAFLSQPGRLSPVNRKILYLLSKTLSPNLTFKYVTAKTTQDEVLGMGSARALGWYSLKAGKEEIYVKSPEYVLSQLNDGLLLHEMVHAAIAYTIESPSTEAKALIAELEDLRAKAMEVATDEQKQRFKAALGDIQEFVAYGLTNEEFQKGVLEKISMPSKTRGNTLLNGLQKFIATLTEMLLGRPDAEIENGMAVLVSNVSGLFTEAAAFKDKPKRSMDFYMEADERIESYTTLEILQGLDNGAVEPVFQEHLGNLLSGIVEALHGPFGAFAAAMRKTEANNPLAVWLKAIETGRAPFASAIVASGFAGSAQEDFAMQQVELTVKAALEGNDATTTMVYKELTKLYAEARATLKPSDFASQADYDFVFSMTTDNGERSDYLARFAALGLANQKFNKLLKFNTLADTREFGDGNTLFDRLVNIYEKVLAFFSEKVTHVFGGQVADEKLQALVGQLVDIEAKKRHALILKQDGNRYIDPIERGVKRVTESLREKATAALNSDMVRDSSSAVVRATGTLARTVAGGYADQYMESLRKVRDAQFKERDGLGAGLLNELKGPIQAFGALLREVKHRENQRKKLITEHAAMAVKAFKNGASFTKEQTTSVTNVFMRTGAHNLLAHFTLAEMDKLLSTPAELTKAIASFEARLNTRAKSLYVQQANGLGFYKATGGNPLDVLMLNGHAIARLAGTQYTNLVSEEEAKAAEPVITALVSLYALRYSHANEKAMAKEILRAENGRTDGENGVDFLLKVHQKLEQDSLERLFNGNPMLMEHGYTPDIVNPHTKVTTANVADGQRLMAQGYSKGAKVYADPADPSAELRNIYVLRDGGLAPWLSGIMSLTSMQSKGSSVHSGYMDVRNNTGLGNAQLQASITNAKLDNLQTVIDPGRDMSKERRSNLAPVYNDKGQIVNWRYLMQAKTKDDLLERDNRFDQVLGTLAGSIFDKVSSQESNEKAIGALREQYREDHSYNSDAYVMVGAKSKDPEMRELWQMLPDGTKRAVRKIWGIDGMYVRKDSLDIFFGYRKLSAADFLRKERAALDGVQRIARNVFHLYAKTRGMDEQQADDFAKRMGVALAKGERGWMEIVQAIKDVIVVKNIFTLLGNIYSNDSLLFAKGVDDRWKHQLVAIKGAMAYQEDSRKLMELQTKLELGYTQGKDAQMRDQVVELRDRIDRNPVKKLIDAGLMPTIVEDVAADEDIYSYKTLLQRKTEGITNRVPEGLKTVGRNVFMTRDTKAYQFLSKTTQLSDFVARYALYQHLTTRAENPLTHEDAIQEASDSFVNYDVPMHRTLQYTDDMGFTPFSKYFLRIQRVLVDTLRENPARVLGLAALGQLVDLGPIVLDSSWIHHFGNNPFRSGALQGFGVIDELPAVAASMALIK